MTIYEKLQEEAFINGLILIDDYVFKSKRIKGLYCDNVIALNSGLKDSNEKACVLSEELGHHYTTVGDIIEQNSINNQRQEQKARCWAYNRQVGLMGLIKAFEQGCQNTYEAANFLEVTEEFLTEVVSYYRSKYGLYKCINNYIIYFIPTLSILKLF